MSPSAGSRPASTWEAFGHSVGVKLKILVFNNEDIRVPAGRQPWFGCRAPRRALVIVTTSQTEAPSLFNSSMSLTLILSPRPSGNPGSTS